MALFRFHVNLSETYFTSVLCYLVSPVYLSHILSLYVLSPGTAPPLKSSALFPLCTSCLLKAARGYTQGCGSIPGREQRNPSEAWVLARDWLGHKGFQPQSPSGTSEPGGGRGAETTPRFTQWQNSEMVRAQELESDCPALPSSCCVNLGVLINLSVPVSKALKGGGQ